MTCISLNELVRENAADNELSADVGLQMLQSPFEQQFEDTGEEPNIFVATVDRTLLRQTHQLEA